MRRLRPLTAIFLLLASGFAMAAPADAATRHIVRGRGFGHGVGLSQYGAYGYALKGSSYRAILAHYYRRTRVERAPTRAVRVLLQSNDRFVRFRGASRAGTRRLRPSSTYVVRASVGGLAVYTRRGRLVGRFVAPLEVSRRGHPMRLLGPALNDVRDGLYRGSLVLTPGLVRGVTAANELGVDSYVQGVVPGEMPSSWHPEALKAQAVAARSYALATRKPLGTFDLYPDTRSQVYRGLSGETASTNSAVRATARQVLTHAGLVALTYYFSTSGGHTEDVENVFFGNAPTPYLRGVDDPHDGISPRHRWRLSFTTRQLQGRLGSYVLGRFRRIRVLTRGASPRIVRARVDGTGGSRTITGPALRSRLQLFDSWASFSRLSTSQAGASALAAALLAPVKPPRPLALVGSVEPAPPGRLLHVERRRGGWRPAGEVRTRTGGRYRARVRSPGVYRVRAGSVVGPSVRVR